MIFLSASSITFIFIFICPTTSRHQSSPHHPRFAHIPLRDFEHVRVYSLLVIGGLEGLLFFEIDVDLDQTRIQLIALLLD